MKYVVMFCFVVISAAGLVSCKNCKICHAEMLGVKSPPQEYCGDELKKIQQTPGVVCE